jgi:hypothetical protein
MRAQLPARGARCTAAGRRTRQHWRCAPGAASESHGHAAALHQAPLALRRGGAAGGGVAQAARRSHAAVGATGTGAVLAAEAPPAPGAASEPPRAHILGVVAKNGASPYGA